MIINSEKVKHIVINSSKETLYTRSSNKTKKQPVTFQWNLSGGGLILLTSNLMEAHQLMLLEAERLLEDGWEAIQVSARSYIAVLNRYGIYLETFKKGLSVKVFEFEEPSSG